MHTILYKISEIFIQQLMQIIEIFEYIVNLVVFAPQVNH
jgi:hypothetical protein